ncbi:MAG: hypothetical protein HQ481_12075 [Alphaproteobacteria bacterium]|nr:hypothetical protein [Alphaproteobacteria bacterium]
MMGLLAWFGKRATSALAVGVFVGLAIPDLATLTRPLLVPAIVVMLIISLLRLDPTTLRASLRSPTRTMLAVGFVLLISPLLGFWGAEVLGLTGGVRTALVVWTASPPLVSVTAIAVIVGLDSALALTVMTLCGLLMPLTLPPLVLSLIDLDLDIAPWVLSGRLAALMLGAALAAAAIRRLTGPDRLNRASDAIDGGFVLIMLVFVVSVMDGVTATALADPGRIAGLAALVFTVSLVMQAAGFLLFLPAGRRTAATIGLTAGNRNMAVVLSAAPSAFAPEVFLYLAMLQFPIYLLPAILRPLYRRLGQ